MNEREDNRKKIEQDVELVKKTDETEAEKLIKKFNIKIDKEKLNQGIGPQVVDVCSQELAFSRYKRSPNIYRLL